MFSDPWTAVKALTIALLLGGANQVSLVNCTKRTKEKGKARSLSVPRETKYWSYPSPVLIPSPALGSHNDDYDVISSGLLTPFSMLEESLISSIKCSSSSGSCSTSFTSSTGSLMNEPIPFSVSGSSKSLISSSIESSDSDAVDAQVVKLLPTKIPLDVFWACSKLFPWDTLVMLKQSCRFLNNCLNINAEGVIRLFEWVVFSKSCKIDGAAKSKKLYKQYRVSLDPKGKFLETSKGSEWSVGVFLQCLVESKLFTWENFIFHRNPQRIYDPLPMLARHGLESFIPGLVEDGFRLVKKLTDDRRRRNFLPGDGFDQFYTACILADGQLNEQSSLEEIDSIDFKYVSCERAGELLLGLARRRNYQEKFQKVLNKSIQAGILSEDSSRKLLVLNVLGKDENAIKSLAGLLTYILKTFLGAKRSFEPAFRTAWNTIVKNLRSGALTHDVIVSSLLKPCDTLPRDWKEYIIESISCEGEGHLVLLLGKIALLETFASQADLFDISLCVIKLHAKDKAGNFKKKPLRLGHSTSSLKDQDLSSLSSPSLELFDTSLKSVLNLSLRETSQLSLGFSAWLDGVFTFLHKSINLNPNMAWASIAKMRPFLILKEIILHLSSVGIWRRPGIGDRFFGVVIMSKNLEMLPFYLEHILKPVYKVEIGREADEKDFMWWTYVTAFITRENSDLLLGQILSVTVSDNVLKLILRFLVWYWNQNPMSEPQAIGVLQRSLENVQESASHKSNSIIRERKLRSRKSGKFLRDLMMTFDPIIKNVPLSSTCSLSVKEPMYCTSSSSSSNSALPPASPGEKGRSSYMERMFLQWTLVMPRVVHLIDKSSKLSASSYKKEWAMVHSSIETIFPKFSFTFTN